MSDGRKRKEVRKMTDGYEEMLITIITIAVICLASGGGDIYAWLCSEYNKWRNLKNED